VDELRYREAERALWRSVGIEPEERRIPLACSGGEVRVQIVGEGEPAVFIHGAPNAGSTWAPLIPHLDGVCCYLVDRPGTGLSDPFVLHDDVHGFASRFAGEVLDGLGLERSHLVGSSLGGFIALMSAAAQPERFERMVQLGCPGLVPGFQTPAFMKAMRHAPVRWLINVLPPSERAEKQLLTQIGHGASVRANKIPQAMFDWGAALQRHTDTMRNEGAMIGGLMTRHGAPPALTIPDSVLASVSSPTLFLWGEDDPFGGSAVAEHTVGLVPGAELVLLPKSTGHLPWLDDPEGIGRRATGFLVGAGDRSPGLL
jgi:pimeloyl-ACP methyl ester carboxylesterase